MAGADNSGTERHLVGIGCRVRFQNLATQEILIYTIVRPDDADPPSGRISESCPLSIAAIGRTAGETATVNAREEVRSYRILSVEAPAEPR